MEIIFVMVIYYLENEDDKKKHIRIDLAQIYDIIKIFLKINI